MQQDPEISVVVATRDRPALLAQLLASLGSQSLEPTRFELVIVDDGSSPPALTPERLACGAAVTTLRNVHALGPAAARNRGWRAGSGNLICFTDDDCLPEHDWLERVLAAANTTPGAVLQGRTIPRRDQRAGLGPLSRTMRCEQLDPNFPTTNLSFPRPLLERLGGFDEQRYTGVVGGEDTDLVWRALGNGSRVIFCPEPTVQHAVEQVGLRGVLRIATRRSALRPFVDHRELRREAFVAGVFRKRTHAELIVALVACALGRRWPLALAGAIPYLRSLRARGRTRELAAVALTDLAETAATLQAGVEERTPMI